MSEKDLEYIHTAFCDLRVVKHAKFECVYNGKGICSNCHRLDFIDNLAKYCRYCGSIMDAENQEIIRGDKNE